MAFESFRHIVFQILLWVLFASNTSATGLATLTPCPDCGSAIAPHPITITAQYQTASTCKPSKTTKVFTYTKRHTTKTATKVKTIPSCTVYAWVSTTIPVYYNGTKESTIVTSTTQPVTFSRVHYTETHSTVLPVTKGYYYGAQQNGTRNSTEISGTSNSTWISGKRNSTRILSTTKFSYTTIDVKNYCDYNSIGPIAISGYEGSGLCTDCGPDASSALTQELTVVSCANTHCTTFNETWIARPRTVSSGSKFLTTTTTNTYCPTATPTSAIPGYSSAVPAASATTEKAATSYFPSEHIPSGTYSAPTGSFTTPHGSVSSTSSGYPLKTIPPTHTEPEPEAEPTDGYGDGSGDEPGADPSGGHEADPSGGYQHEAPEPTAYHPQPDHYKLFKRKGLEKPHGRVQKRAGLLYWSL